MSASSTSSEVQTLSPSASALKRLFSFPNPVNEMAARMVAGMVVVMVLAITLAEQWWVLFLLAYGFLARVSTGPKLSPAALLATRVLAPMLRLHKPVPGPPKRFAQGIGFVFSTTALVLYFVASSAVAAKAVLAVLGLFAALEAGAGFCAGCFLFGYLMRWGIIPESVCRECVVRPQPSA